MRRALLEIKQHRQMRRRLLFASDSDAVVVLRSTICWPLRPRRCCCCCFSSASTACSAPSPSSSCSSSNAADDAYSCSDPLLLRGLRNVSIQQQRQLSRHHQITTTTTTRWFSSSSSSSSANNDDDKKVQLSSFPLDSPECNVTSNVASRVDMNLHRRPNHPLSILSNKIVDYFDDDSSNNNNSNFNLYDNLSPIVSTAQNFDSLRIPADHVSRSKSDTYYLDAGTVLRTHTSAHQVDILSDSGNSRFLVAGDVYRRDEIDRSHYPVFHQMEGVKIFNDSDDDPHFGGSLSEQEQVEYIEKDLKRTLEGLAVHLFGNRRMRWVDEYFPFTHPSYELEILFQGGDNDVEADGGDDDGEWMEVLGCGVIHPQIMVNANREGEKGWAFGLGLERLAMILFDIPDIRLFWSEDERFHNQFKTGEIVKFQPYSKYPPCYKDISFWLPNDNNFHVNDLNEVVRDAGGDLVEQVELIDVFVHPKTNRISHCYRISYRSMDRSLTNQEIDEIQASVRERVTEMGAELR